MKETQTEVPVVDVIEKRWSPLAFSPKNLSAEQITTLFEAARWTPSSYGEEPWRYIYAGKGDPGRDVLEGLLAEGNAWAKNAGLLILSFTRKNFTYNGKPNRHHMHDVGAASYSMVLQATAMGLVSHQMAGFDVEKANAALGVPDDFLPGSMIAIGEHGDVSALSDDWKKREDAPRKRNPQSAFAMPGRWKEAA